mgnify:CR=1 FL=1
MTAASESRQPPEAGLRIKVCGVKDPGIARLIQKLGGRYVGMIHHSASPRHLELGELEALIDHVEPGRRIVVSVDPALELLERFLRLGADVCQVHLRGADASAVNSALGEYERLLGRERLWIAPRLPPGASIPDAVLQRCGTILVDTYHPEKVGGTGLAGDWPLFREYSVRYPDHRMILSGGLNPGNLREAVEVSGAETVDLSSGVESSPGVKDPRRIEALFENAEDFRRR